MPMKAAEKMARNIERRQRLTDQAELILTSLKAALTHWDLSDDYAKQHPSYREGQRAIRYIETGEKAD